MELEKINLSEIIQTQKYNIVCIHVSAHMKMLAIKFMITKQQCIVPEMLGTEKRTRGETLISPVMNSNSTDIIGKLGLRGMIMGGLYGNGKCC